MSFIVNGVFWSCISTGAKTAAKRFYSTTANWRQALKTNDRVELDVFKILPMPVVEKDLQRQGWVRTRKGQEVFLQQLQKLMRLEHSR